MIGYSPADLAKMRFHDITHPDDIDLNVDYLAKARRGEIDSYRIQKRYLRANGEILWAELNAVILRDESGQLAGMISIITDIGAFKTAEERQNFLLSELAHRSKNLFTVVLNVVSQTKADTVCEFRSQVEARILSLAASQDLMLGQRGNVASLWTLVDRQLGAFVAPGDPRVRQQGTDIVLGTNATRIIGMALHELATNSCKYGALSAPEGQLMLEIVHLPDAQVQITWQERGGPPVAAPTRSGFGRRVVERMVRRTLNADVTLDFDPLGLSWRCRADSGILRH